MAKRDRVIVALVTLFTVIMLSGCRSLSGRQLCAAIRAGQSSKTEAVLKFNPRLINTVFRNGKAPLHVAANSKQLEIAKLLIAKEADVNIKDWKDATALHYAIDNGHIEIAQLLISNGADVNLKGRDGYTALHYATRGGHVEIVRLFIANGADVNIQANNDATALHYATGNWHVELTKLLIANEIDVNTKEQTGLTALHVDMDRSRRYFSTSITNTMIEMVKVATEQIIEALLKADANVSPRDNSFRTPLHIAAENNIQSGAEMLIKAGAKVMDRDNDGKTPLDYAETAEMIKFLKDHGAKEK